MAIHFPNSAEAQKKIDGFSLTLEVTAFGTINAGYAISAETHAIVENSVISFGSTQVPLTAVVNTAILNTDSTKIEYVLWNKKYHLSIGTYPSRRVKKGFEVAFWDGKKNRTAVFEILSAKKNRLNSTRRFSTAEGRDRQALGKQNTAAE
jgi:hypothetical protein